MHVGKFGDNLSPLNEREGTGERDPPNLNSRFRSTGGGGKDLRQNSPTQVVRKTHRDSENSPTQMRPLRNDWEK